MRDHSAVRMRMLLTPVTVKTVDKKEKYVRINLKIEKPLFKNISDVARMAGQMHGPSAKFVTLIADAVDNNWNEVVIGGKNK